MDLSKKIINLFYKATSFLPRGKAIIFESNPNYADNTYWFFKYLIENTDVAERYTLCWMLKDRADAIDELCGAKIKCILREPETVQEKLDHIYYTAFSKFILDCNSYVKKKNKNQKRVFLGHGMPLKLVLSYDLKKGDIDMNTITSYSFNEHFYSIGDTDENLRNFGYCRTDVLFENAGLRKDKDETRIIWMPTYRQHRQQDHLRLENNFPLGLPVIKSHEQMKEINEHLVKNNTVLYIRPHPQQDVEIMKIDELSNIVLCDDNYLNGKPLYQFLTETDALISDYSSVYYDYLALGRPIGLAIEDLDDFSAKWPMMYDYKSTYKCPYLYTVDDLKKFITDTATDNDEYKHEREKARDRFYDFTDGKCCERLYNFMVEEYGM